MNNPVEVKTGKACFDDFYPRIRELMGEDTIDLLIDGELVHGYRSPDSPMLWIRDHSDMLRGARYFDPDLTSAVGHFAATQRANGSLFDFVCTTDGRENWTRYARVPVEADVEYRFVKALYLAWQASGDDAWVTALLPAAEKALTYTLTHPWRWDKKTGLVKRAYTIDTWDFACTAGREDWLHFRIDENTFWGIHHCDNSGLYEACHLLARLYEHLGDPTKAIPWKERAASLKEKANATCWNGRFYTHRVPLDDFRLADTDEEEQLSLSNPMAINRGLATHAMAVAILEEYRRRRQTNETFAEWYSIDPPFPPGAFGDEKLQAGAYVNGGIMPLVGGEIARAAFDHGFEDYGIATLLQYEEMIRENQASYLWYFPDGRPSTAEESTSPEAKPTDGWGASAMLYAFIEGLCGVVDRGRTMSHLHLSPRWAAAGVDQAQVKVGYTAATTTCEYTYSWHKQTKKLDLGIKSPGTIDLHLLLPIPPNNPPQATLNGKTIASHPETIEASPYLNITIPHPGALSIQL